MEDTVDRRDMPQPPSGFSSWLDFAVETFGARGADVSLLLEGCSAEQQMSAARDAARRELEGLRESAQALRLSTRRRIAEKVRDLLAQCGDSPVSQNFDADAWAEQWMDQPLADLGGKSPIRVLHSGGDWRLIEDLLERMRGGLAA